MSAVNGHLVPDPDRRALDLVARASADPGMTGLAAGLQRISRAAVRALPSLTGAVVHLVERDGELSVAAPSDPAARALGELAFAMGVAPSLDALGAGRPVLVVDLQADHRWPGFAGTALEQGVRAVFALPLQVGALGLGSLELYSDRAGPLSRDDLALALALARLAAAMTLAGSGGLAGAAARAAIPEDVDALVDMRPEVHQAQGIVMVALAVSLAEALVRLRAHAFASATPLTALAREVVAGRERPEAWEQD